MKNATKTIVGAAGLISLGAVGISYFDESIERRTMEGMETFVTTYASYPGPVNFAGRSDLVARQSRIMEAVEYLAANGISAADSMTISNLNITGEFTLVNTVWDDTAVPALSFRTGATAPSLQGRYSSPPSYSLGHPRSANNC